MTIVRRLAIRYIRAKFKLLASMSKKKAAAKALELFRTPPSRVKKQPGKIFAEAERLEFVIEGITVRGFRWGQYRGERVLIVHGFESSVLNFGHYVQPLLNNGYEVLAFDAPAHGISGGKLISAPLFCDMIIAVNKKYGPVDSFIAHSFGGLALALALEKIPGNEHCKAVLMAPATETKTAIDQFFTLIQLDKDEEVRKEFDRLIFELGGHPAEWYSIKRAMDHIKSKVLWLHDETDKQTPVSDALEVKKDHHPNIQFIISNGIGHSRLYREPEVVKKVISFLG